jgi:prevent-host-death family protein
LYKIAKNMNVVSATEARANLPELINRAEYGKERILIE